MPKMDRHLTDEELLLIADGELSAGQQQHLRACPACSARMAKAETVLAEFAALHHATFDPRVPPAEDARFALQARLAADRSYSSHSAHWKNMALVAAALFLLVCVGMKFLWQHPLNMREQASRNPSLPDHTLTPGKYQPVRLADVCGPRPYEQARVTSIALKRKVLAEYGMPAEAVSNHEIDFLVIPELGGTQDLQNLWPEPYGSTEWNARVKDALEERLHDMVCEQKIDLATAQHDIATDWISAYKKYFHTDKPIFTGHSS